MTDRAQQILEHALLLSLDERAEIAIELLHSLDETNRSPDDERRWAEEITRRAERAIAGKSVGQEAEVVLRSIEARLRR